MSDVVKNFVVGGGYGLMVITPFMVWGIIDYLVRKAIHDI